MRILVQSMLLVSMMSAAASSSLAMIAAVAPNAEAVVPLKVGDGPLDKPTIWEP